MLKRKEVTREGEYIAVCDDGRKYPATFVNKYFPGGVFFFCIPSDVKVIGYIPVEEV